MYLKFIQINEANNYFEKPKNTDWGLRPLAFSLQDVAAALFYIQSVCIVVFSAWVIWCIFGCLQFVYFQSSCSSFFPARHHCCHAVSCAALCRSAPPDAPGDHGGSRSAPFSWCRAGTWGGGEGAGWKKEEKSGLRVDVGYKRIVQKKGREWWKE